MKSFRLSLLWFLLAVGAVPAAQTPTPSKIAPVVAQGGQVVAPISDTTIIAEAEEFQPQGKSAWRTGAWGENYYCATFANSFLSRKAFLGAPEQCDRSVATIHVNVPKAGKYLALVRYEACYRFETQFRLQIEQKGKLVLDRLYGARDNLKIWAFREKLKKEVAWSWGASENIVWEGHDASAELEPGKATLRLIADKQPTPAARRNVDLVMLISDTAEVAKRIDKENYLPLDGLLTQAGDVFLKLHNLPGGSSMSLTVPNGTEHSPYWVHLRNWKPKTLTVEPGKSTDWVEVGSLLDSLNDGQWTLTAKAKDKLHYRVEIAVKSSAHQPIETIGIFDNLKEGSITLAYDADTRYSRRIRRVEEVLYELVAYLKKHPVEGTPPQRTLIYGYTFAPKPGDAKYTAALEEFRKLMGATALGRDNNEDAENGKLVRGYLDVRGVPTAKLEEYCKKLQAQGKSKNIAVISLGDEIGLATPPAQDHSGFHKWLQSKKLTPADVVPKATRWDEVKYSADAKTAKDNPHHYYSKIYSYRYGIRHLKERTDILRRYFPNAGIGANFSPHHGSMYIGQTHHWISLFREGGMTMPWGEDYIWQVPVGTQQMNFLMLDMFRAGIKGKKDAKIHYYVMPHTPGNTTASWRRQWYGDLAHGAKVLNLFEFRPVQAAYTENHVSNPAMYQEVRKSIHELGKFEDIIQDGQVKPANVALWFSETADVWGDLRPPFDVAKRCLYAALRHQQLPLDCVVDGDDLASYKVLYVTDTHVSRAGTKRLGDWLNGGGILVATAGAGLFDEFNQPNEAFAKLLGLTDRKLAEVKSELIRFEKQDLPFAKPVDSVFIEVKGFGPESTKSKMEVYGLRSQATAKGATILGKFVDATPALTRHEMGKGTAFYWAFLPSLSYFKPALPLRPVDRGATNGTMAHFLPTLFDAKIGIVWVPLVVSQSMPVRCSTSLVESTVIEAPQGVVISLVNWTATPQKQMLVAINFPVPTASVTLASGRPVEVRRQGELTEFRLDLDVADALILRK